MKKIIQLIKYIKAMIDTGRLKKSKILYIYIYIIGVSEFKYITNGTENLYKDIREQTFLIKKTTLIYI